MFCFDRKFRLLLPCCFLKQLWSSKPLGLEWEPCFEEHDPFCMIQIHWSLRRLFWNRNFFGCWFYSFYLPIYIHVHVLMGKTYICTGHTITHMIQHTKGSQTIINTNDTCTLLQHEIGIYLGIPRYAYIIRNYCNKRPFLHFCTTKRWVAWKFLWLCPSGSFSFILRYSQSSTLEFVTIAGWVCGVFPTCLPGTSHGANQLPFARKRGQAAMFSNRFRTRADHEYLKSTSGALIEGLNKPLVKIAGNIGQLGFTPIK